MNVTHDQILALFVLKETKLLVLEAQVAALVKTNQELQQTVADLKAEIAKEPIPEGVKA